MAEDIRFSKKAQTLTHDSARGKVKRNANNFTRGSQLFHHEVLMTWAGAKLPIYVWLATFIVLLSSLGFFTFKNHEVHLVLMRCLATLWEWMSLNPLKAVNLTLPSGNVVAGTMQMIPYHPAVEAAWAKMIQITVSSVLGASFICVPLTIWFVDFSRRRGSDILTERHERGAVLVDRGMLREAVDRHNWDEHAKECSDRTPSVDPKAILNTRLKDRVKDGFHAPYRLAGVPVPWRLEQSHSMFIGTTGAGKTTELKRIVTQARARGHRCVIFDLTGSFVESFYDENTDVVLNPMDKRCEAWSIFNDCESYAEFMSAATALVPGGHNAEDDFWQKAARTLFTEMCMKMLKMEVRSNGGLAYFLMQSDLKTISKQLEGTLAGPLMAPQAAKMAESIRATFNTHANVLRFLPEPGEGRPPFSINKWMTEDIKDGSILFITSTHPDLVLNRPLLTLWMDLAVNALFRMGRTRNLRTWFLLDEVHALHRLPAIEHGLQTARAVGGAFILGMHSFDKLEETYGENGAINLTSLARTKLILATADIETAKRCSDFIGSREVRQMDEAYSYGYNNSRDASTITPRKQVEELVMPDDITNLPSLHGYVKFPDGFPAARIKLTWQDYPQRAEGFERVTTMRAAEYVPSDEEAAEMGVDGREGEAPESKPVEQLDLGDAGKSAAEHEADRLREEMEGRVTGLALNAERTLERDAQQTSKGPNADQANALAKLGYGANQRDAEKDTERTRSTIRSGQERGIAAKDHRGGHQTAKGRPDDQESEIMREERRGMAVIDEKERDHHSVDDDMEMGR